MRVRRHRGSKVVRSGTRWGWAKIGACQGCSKRKSSGQISVRGCAASSADAAVAFARRNPPVAGSQRTVHQSLAPVRTGASIADLISQKLLHPHMRQRIPGDLIQVWGHQEDAIRAIGSGRTTVVSTGTGSGRLSVSCIRSSASAWSSRMRTKPRESARSWFIR